MRRLLLYFNLILGFVLMSPSAIAQYCTTGLYSTGCAVGDQIDGFSMGGFSNSATGCSTGGWGDYTSDTVTVALGSVNTFTITYGTAYIQYGAMWIDWNNDQDFDDPGEHVWSSSTNAASHTDNAVIPLTPAVGNYRMRIRSDFSNAMAANGSCTPSTWGEAEDYTLKVTPAPACAPPIFISASNITSSSAVIHWQSLDTTFNVEYGPAGFTPGTGTTVATNPDSLLISGLLANTAYDVYVQNDCSASGAGTSTWTGPFTFMTSCVSVAVYPTTESFDGSTWAPSTPGWPYSGDTVDQCWSRSADISTQFAWVVRSGTSGGWQTGPTGDHTSGVGNYLCAKGNNFGGNDSIFFYTPDYDLSALNVPLLSFYYHMFGGNGLGDIVVQGSTNGTNWVTLTTLSGQKQTASSDAYVEEIVDITSVKSSATKLRFVGVKNNGTMDMAIDDVRIEEAPPCPKPTGFNFTNITSSGTDINFLSQGHSFPVEWGLSGFVQGTGTQDTVYMSGASLTGMPSNSLIDVYIQNDCTDSAKGVSTWAGPFTFRTLCNAMMHGYAQSFDNLTVPDMDPCWHFITGGGFGVGTAQSYAPFPWNSLQPISPPNIARLSNSSSEYSILITPELYGLDGDTSQIRFDAGQDIFNGLPMSLVMGTMSDRDDTATFVAFDTLNIPANSWQSYTLYLNNVPAGHKFVAFRHGNFNPTFSNFYIEDFFFEPIPSCLPPTNMMATSVTTNSATFTWTQGGSTTVNIEYGPQGFVQGTGTSVSGITVNPYTLTGLPANTCYDVYFQADCGGGDVSPWVGPVSFCTLCNVYTAPFAENFDGGGWIASGNNNGNSIDNCWGSMPMVSDPKVFKWIPRSTGPTSGNGPLNDNTGLNFMYCEASGSVPGDTAYLTTPAIDVSSLNAPALYFDQHRFYSTGTFGLADMDILVSNDFGATWTTVYNVTGNVQTSASDPWSSHIVNLPNYVGDTILVSFRQAGDGCCGDAAIDNVEIKEAPSCPDPANLNVKGITDSSAIFEWVSNNSAATNQVWWGPQGFWQGTGTTGGTMLSTAADSMAVDTLNSAYCYDVYVRTICTGGDTSAWVGPFTFCTLCSPFTAPFIESFNNPGAEPQCWGNYNATGATGLNDIWKNTSVNWPAYGASGVSDNTGNGGYAMGVDGSSSRAKGVRLETPLIDVSALTSPELRFHIFSNNTTNPGDNNPMYID
ncbi:MAG: GEVED domain-containing protein, partial [Schleiferiaceae bacterium]|nr:GEVED domain-containing protein [Schleiferiaceae bacterium]